MSSKSLGFIAVALSVATVPVLYGMRFFPALLSLALVTLLVAIAVYSIIAARRGSKLWLLLTLWPVTCTVVLLRSIFAE